MTIIDDLNARIKRGKASDRAVADATGMTVEEYDADVTAVDPVPLEDLPEEELKSYYDLAGAILADLLLQKKVGWDQTKRSPYIIDIPGAMTGDDLLDD